MKLTFLFWNVCGAGLKTGSARYVALQRLLTQAATAHDVDLLILAESPFAGGLTLTGFKAANTLLPPNKTGCRLEIYHKNTVALTPLSGVGRGTVQEVTSVSSNSPNILFLLAALHFDSGLYDISETARWERQNKAIKFADEVHLRENIAGHRRSLVVGDFNYEPYDFPLIWDFGFRAVAAKSQATAKRANSRPYFYNPMWGHFGDTIPGPSGTFVHDSTWKMPDQLLIGSDLLKVWEDTNLQILSTLGGGSLLNQNKMARTKSSKDKNFISDHLPLLFWLDV